MVNIRLIGLTIEVERERTIIDRLRGNDRWYKTVALQLSDEGKAVAEWFYLIAASPDYLKNPDKNGPVLDDKYVVVQDEFSLSQLTEIAQDRLAMIHANNMDDFYQQMDRNFLHEK